MNAANRTTILCSSVVIVCLSFVTVRCGKFAVCGKSRGVVTASRSAALATKILQKCGLKFARRFTLSPPAIIKIAEKLCLGYRLCYAYVNPRVQKNTNDIKERLRSCIIKGARSLFTQNSEMFSVTVEQLNAMLEYLNRCLTDDLISTDGSVMLGTVRYVLKSANLAMPLL
ncbi:uncharacterized protein [Dermacentor andersoni]|uniref:uncharacterized protein isoform X1 n=1 Tax=Dermacentor andersoni TaxID=34620 RepID=UPI002155E566|nr:uncharacterized protein LOC126540288 isoform X1 [Dermacentor andersoni]